MAECQLLACIFSGRVGVQKRQKNEQKRYRFFLSADSVRNLTKSALSENQKKKGKKHENFKILKQKKYEKARNGTEHICYKEPRNSIRAI